MTVAVKQTIALPPITLQTTKTLYLPLYPPLYFPLYLPLYLPLHLLLYLQKAMVSLMCTPVLGARLYHHTALS